MVMVRWGQAMPLATGFVGFGRYVWLEACIARCLFSGTVLWD